MGKVKDLTGQRFGRWTAIECTGRNKSGGAMWLCRCDCGTVRVIDGRSLRDGTSKSCGCLSKELSKNRKTNYKHGGKSDRLYGVWNGIKDRCYNPKSKHYHRYGGRGITMCDQWRYDYTAFRDWALAYGYDPTAKKYQYTIDRIDNDAGYSPDNCRIVSQKVQCSNKGNNHFLTYNGETKTISEWAECTGIRKDTIRRRIVNYHWDVEKALTTKPSRKSYNNS